MSLMMEMGALALGSGSVVVGVFGMNLVSGLEEHPQGNPEFFCTILGHLTKVQFLFKYLKAFI